MSKARDICEETILVCEVTIVITKPYVLRVLHPWRRCHDVLHIQTRQVSENFINNRK